MQSIEEMDKKMVDSPYQLVSRISEPSTVSIRLSNAECSPSTKNMQTLFGNPMGSQPKEKTLELHPRCFGRLKKRLPSREPTYPPQNGILNMIFLFPRWDIVSCLESTPNEGLNNGGLQC